jgi:hypothetical protein
MYAVSRQRRIASECRAEEEGEEVEQPEDSPMLVEG